MQAIRDVTFRTSPQAATGDACSARLVAEVACNVPTRRLLTADDVANWLGITKQAVYRLVREYRLPSISVGRYVRFEATAIQRWIDAGGAALDRS
jgi:excisionase family DNA binding protein